MNIVVAVKISSIRNNRINEIIIFVWNILNRSVFWRIKTADNRLSLYLGFLCADKSGFIGSYVLQHFSPASEIFIIEFHLNIVLFCSMSLIRFFRATLASSSLV